MVAAPCDRNDWRTDAQRTARNRSGFLGSSRAKVGQNGNRDDRRSRKTHSTLYRSRALDARAVWFDAICGGLLLHAREMAAEDAVQVIDLRKEHLLGQTAVHALRGVSLIVPRGAFFSIIGPSGSGKSTLLHCIGGLERATSGSVFVDGTCVSSLSEEDATIFRRRNVGVVFQFFNLLQDLSVEDNVAVPLMLDGMAIADVRDRVAEVLQAVGLSNRALHMPGELSGGEMQRVAIARALALRPALILADEPTGNLDSAAGAMVLDLMRRACDERGQTLILVTHDANAAARGDRIVELHDGMIKL